MVYRAVPVEHLSPEAMYEISQRRIDVAVFLSSRTAAVFCSLVIASGIVDACARMTAVAISSKVAEALRPADFGQLAVATSPSRDAVLEAILRLDTKDA